MFEQTPASWRGRDVIAAFSWQRGWTGDWDPKISSIANFK
jgi:hypothetical protein